MKENSELQSFLETGILGKCDYTEAALHGERDGLVSTRFGDSEVAIGPAGRRVRRTMMVDGRNFLVSSFFPVTTATPTERLLDYIDFQDSIEK